MRGCGGWYTWVGSPLSLAFYSNPPYPTPSRRPGQLQAQRETARAKGEREARAAEEMGSARAAATEASLRLGKEALAREILAAVAQQQMLQRQGQGRK